ncbi:uncharacterized protein LOC144180028 [Haemaphysalis longicornis]
MQRHEHCTLHCGPEEVLTPSASAGSFSVPADLFSSSVVLRVRQPSRVPDVIFRTSFHKKQAGGSGEDSLTRRSIGCCSIWPYKYTVRSYYGDPNSTSVVFSAISVARHKARQGFELFLYTEMVVVFVMASVLSVMALFTIAYIVVHALGLSAIPGLPFGELVVNGGPEAWQENQAQGDHRRPQIIGAPRRQLAERSEVSARGDN